MEKSMITGRRIVSLLVLVQVATSVVARGDDELQRWRCPYTQDGACTPNPKTYGWYKTRWRKWPSDPTEPTPAESIPTPTPAKPESSTKPETKKDAESEELPTQERRPTREPDSNPVDKRPTKAEQAPDALETPPANTESDPGLPPELKSDLPQPRNLEKLLPDDGGDEPPQPPGREPSMIPDDEDPFKDDPLQSEQSGDSSGRSRRQPQSTSQTGVRWRADPRLKLVARAANNKSQVMLADAQSPQNSAPKATSGAANAPQRVKASFSQSRGNPLRAQTETATSALPSPVADEEVVPAADWSPEVARPAAGTWRVNPLRASR
jgi:hypothetical protein